MHSASLHRAHCMHPNRITCHAAFLFLTHFLPSHLSLSFISSFFPPLCIYWAKIWLLLSSVAPFLSCLFSDFLSLFLSISLVIPLHKSSTSFHCFFKHLSSVPVFPTFSLCSSFLLISSSLCLPNVILIMEKVHVQAGSIN